LGLVIVVAATGAALIFNAGCHRPNGGSGLDEDIQPLALTESEIDDLAAFLASLTSPDYKELAAREWERQRALSRTSRPQRDTKRAFGPKPPRPKAPQP
jgi:cytochrome c peroxidase